MSQILPASQDLIDADKAPEAYGKLEKALPIFRGDQNWKALAEAMMMMVECLNIQDRKREGKEFAKTCLNDFREAGNIYGEGTSHLAMADLYATKMGAHGREVAAHSAGEAVSIFRSLGDTRMLGKALLVRSKVRFAEIDKRYGETEFRESEALTASEELDEALSIFKQAGDRRSEAKALSGLAHARCFGDLAAQWTPPALDSLKIHRDLQDTRMEAYDLYMIAYWYHMTQEWMDVLSYAKQALAVYKDLKSKNGFAASCLQWIYKAHMEMNEEEEAMQAIKDNLAWFAEIDDVQGQVACHDLLVDMYTKDDAPDEALAAAETALELVRVLGDKRWESHLLSSVANVHINKETPEGKDKAINAMQQSLKVFQKVKDMKGEGHLYHNLAHIFMKKEKYKEALQAAQKERTCFKRANEDKLEAVALMTIYQVHVCRRKPGQAIKAADEAVKIFQKIEDKPRAASALVMSASAYVMDGKKEKAVEVCKQALKVSKEIGDREGEEYALSVIQQIEKKEGGASRKETMDDVDEVATAADTAAAAPAKPDLPALDPQMVMDKVTEVAQMATAGDDMDVDSPLMDLGMDSLSSVAFRNSLMGEFQGLKLPASLMFDYPNIRLIADEILEVSRTTAVSLK